MDDEAESLDRSKLEKTLKELESAVDGAEWREDENGLTAPGGFEMRCSIAHEDPEDYVPSLSCFVLDEWGAVASELSSCKSIQLVVRGTVLQYKTKGFRAVLSSFFVQE